MGLARIAFWTVASFTTEFRITSCAGAQRHRIEAQSPLFTSFGQCRDDSAPIAPATPFGRREFLRRSGHGVETTRTL